MDGKDKSSRSGSKTNLNESTMPLLDDSELGDKGDSPGEKEKIELKEKSSSSSVAEDEKDDSRTEKADGTTEEADDDGQVVTEEPGKKGKNKSKKNKAAGKHKRSPSCVHTMSVGLNLLDRDEKHVNEHINIQFEDVIAEPDSSHSFDGVWRVAYVLFGGTKFWFYRLLAALCALPCALCWGINFACISFCHIWAITPLLRILDLLFFFVKRIWSAIVHTLLDPIFESIGMLFATIRVHHHRQEHASP